MIYHTHVPFIYTNDKKRKYIPTHEKGPPLMAESLLRQCTYGLTAVIAVVSVRPKEYTFFPPVRSCRPDV